MPDAQTINLSFPLLGLSDEMGHENQPPLTTEEAVNVRGIDPRTGRKQGAQRAGMSKWVTPSIHQFDSGGSSGENPAVRELVVIKYDSRNTTYTAQTATPATSEWARTTPADDDARRVATDRQGNVIVLDGPASVARYNSEGTLLNHFEIPLVSDQQRVRALAVDRIDAVYVGVSKSPKNALGQVFRYTIDEEGDYQQDWALPVSGICQDLKARNGLLYVLENDPISGALPDGIPGDGTGVATVHVFDSLDAAVTPREIQRWDVPYPASGIEVNSAGAVFVSCFPNTLRKVETEDCSVASVDWSPEMLPDWGIVKWGWWDARDLVGPDGTSVTYWADKTLNGRDLFFDGQQGPTSSFQAPVLNSSGLCDEQTVEFAGNQALATVQTSGSADDKGKGQTQNLSMLPTFDGSRYVTFLLVCPEPSDAERNVLFFQEGNIDIWFVANEGNKRVEVTEGKIRVTASRAHIFDAALLGNIQSGPSTGSVGANANRIRAGDYTQSGGSSVLGLRRDTALFVLRHGGDDVFEASSFRLNGTEVDSFTFRRERSTNPSVLGNTDPANEGDIDNDGDEPPEYVGFVGQVAEIITIRDNRIEAGDAANRDITAAEIEKFEGYLAHRWGVQHNLAFAHPYRASPPSLVSGGSTASQTSDVELSAEAGKLSSKHGLVIKYGPEGGNLHWVFAGAGAGFGVALDDDDGVYTWGEVVGGPSGGSSGPDNGGYDVTVRKLVDDGTDFALAWVLASSDYPTPTYPIKAAVDGEKNLYLPVHLQTDTRHLVKITAAGAIEWNIGEVTGATKRGYDVALDPRAVDYDDDAIGEPEFFYTVKWQRGPGTGSRTLRKYRLVNAAPETGNVRSVRYLAIAGGEIREVDPDGGTVITPTGGHDALVTPSQWVRGVVLFEQAFIIDGQKMVVYDPRLQTVVAYEPTSAGEFMRRARLLEAWRGRLVAARGDDDPHNWQMTKAGDPYNVDLFPPVQTQEMAVKGNQSPLGPGICPDIINCIMPIDDDLLIFGCDHSIYRLTGDPAAGGVFDLVTDITGVAFGRAWCKDPEGVVYFFGSEGGLYQWNPASGKPVNITEEKIDRRMKSIDLSSFTVRLAWDHRQRGIHILLVPINDVATSKLTHFFWERPTGAFFEVTFGTLGLEPSCMTIVDGDESSDRIVVVGGSDGFLRKWDEDASTDDGTPIDARVVLGPYNRDARTRLMWTAFEFKLASQHDGCWYELMSADNADLLPTFANVSGKLRPGRTPPILDRVSGQSMWIRLRNATSKHWAYESGVAQMALAGVIRT